MTKKEYILTFLDKVKDIREPARGFLVLMRYNLFNEQQVEDLFGVFKSVVASTSDMQKKLKIQKAISAVEAIRIQEQSYESQNFQQSLDQILGEI